MQDWPIGEVRERQGSGSKPYKLKNCDGRVFSCDCPAWRNQGGKKPDVRTCKHLKAERGAAAEEARVTANGGTTVPEGTLAPMAAGLLRNTPHGEKPMAGVLQTPAMISANPWETPEDVRAGIVAAKERELGRKLRQDEKTDLFGPPVLLANDWWDVDGLDPAKWWMSEKLDGVRAYWDGKNFVSRQGNVFNAPPWFKNGLPPTPLDGELWMGRRAFQRTISVVKTTVPDERWRQVKYVIFDAPEETGRAPRLYFEERMEVLHRLSWGRPAGDLFWEVHHQERCDGLEHLMEKLRHVESQGGEGIMLRQPGSFYFNGRSSTLLKVKPFKDDEATVIGHEPGKGQHKGKCGGLVVRMTNGKTFNVGTGLTEADRRSPPPIGAVITYRFTDLTDSGLPKCASFVRVRPDE